MCHKCDQFVNIGLADKSRGGQLRDLTVFTTNRQFDVVHLVDIGEHLLLLLDDPDHGLGPAAPLQPELEGSPPY